MVHNLLLHLYPATTSSVDNFTLAFGLMDACDKYLIDAKSFFPYLVKIFRCCTKFGASEADVLDAYCLAWRLNMRERAQESSRHLHGLDLTRPSLLHEMDRKAGDVRAILALWDLRYRRETAMDSFLERLPLALYRCPEHLRLTVEEAGRLRQNARKAFTSPWFSHKLSMSECLGLSDVFDTPSEASRPGDVQWLIGESRRTGNPPCPVCQATIAESRKGNLDTTDHVTRAAMELPRAVKWPSDKPAAGCL